MEQFVCKQCKKTFKGRRRKPNKYCSKECYFPNMRDRIVVQQPKQRIRVTCQQCGKEELVQYSRAQGSGKRGPYKFCSLACRNAKMKGKKPKNIELFMVRGHRFQKGGIPPTAKGFYLRKKEIIELYQQGHSGLEIAKMLGSSVGPVYLALKKASLTRKHSEARELGLMRRRISTWNKNKKGVMPTPWNKGKKTGCRPWNKGILWDAMRGDKNPSKRLEVRTKISASLKNNPKLIGRPAWNKGKTWEEALGKERAMNLLQTDREKLIARLKSGTFPRQKDTDIEQILKAELIKRGFKENKDFMCQYEFNKKFLCDFAFPEQKVIVECYGDWHHANPAKYDRADPEKLHKIQRKMVGRDKAKEAYIRKVDNNSWKLLVFWGAQIHRDVAKCVDEIEKALPKHL